MTRIHIDPADFKEIIDAAVSEAFRRSKDEQCTDETGRIAVDRTGLAKVLSVSVTTIDRWRQQGLPYFRLDNGKPMFVLDSVKAWMQSREIVATPEEGGAE